MFHTLRAASSLAAMASALAFPVAPAFAAPMPWLDAKLPSSQRADLLVRAMTNEEKLKLVYAVEGTDTNGIIAPKEALAGASYVPANSRLSIPAFISTNAGIGVSRRYDTGATALPSQMALSATWDTDLARSAGQMIGREAYNLGFNVMLAGGVNLPRDPRGGRNFEYSSEDPLLAGHIVGNVIAGVQSNPVISTIKHFALNNLETDRMVMSGNIDLDAFRESDLLAFEIAIETGHPGSVMSAYNRVNDVYAGESKYLLTDVLKRDWKYPYFVMSDWGGTHSTVRAAEAGLDQESAGNTFDSREFFAAPLADAFRSGELPHARLDDMATRILRPMFEFGLFEHRQNITPIDFATDRKVSLKAAEEGIVLLKNDKDLLPVANAKRIAVIGGHADIGVLAGGGSSNVIPKGGNALPDPGAKIFWRPKTWHPDAPVKWIKQLAQPGTSVAFDGGQDLSAAAKLASQNDVAIVFVTEWSHEAMDSPTMTLPDDQDKLIEAVAAANKRTIVVLENNVLPRMPWIDRVAAVVEAWYPGTAGGEAIGRILTGKTNPSGRLPVTVPVDESQLPRLTIQAAGRDDALAVTMQQDQNIFYTEGANVGYKWFEAKKFQPRFPFGFGLSYSHFAIGGLAADATHATARVTNQSNRAGSTVVQFYATPPGGVKRLVGWQRVTLNAKESKTVATMIDPRTIARFSSTDNRWKIAAGSYRISVGASSADIADQRDVQLAAKEMMP